jgi:hypothetical protein
MYLESGYLADYLKFISELSYAYIEEQSGINRRTIHEIAASYLHFLFEKDSFNCFASMNLFFYKDYLNFFQVNAKFVYLIRQEVYLKLETEMYEKKQHQNERFAWYFFLC